MYVIFDKNNKKVVYVGNTMPASYTTDILALAEAHTVPDEYDYLTVANEHYDTEDVIPEVIVEDIEQSELGTLRCELVAHFYTKSVEQVAREKQQEYETLVEKLIRKRYAISQELAILRQRDSKPEEYTAYFEHAENCKLTAKKEIYG